MTIRSSTEPQAGFVGQHGESGYAIQHLSNPQVCTCLLLRYNKSVFQVRAVSGRSSIRAEQMKGGGESLGTGMPRFRAQASEYQNTTGPVRP